MKKFVVATVLALASICLLTPPRIHAQDSDSITIKDPVEFTTYNNATTQSDPKAKAASLESFLQQYPQSVVKKAVLDLLIDTYQGLGDSDHVLSACNRMLQLDSNNLKAILYSVLIKKAQCGKTSDGPTCDDATALANKGLKVTKPAGTADADWKKLIDVAFPIFHSTMATADVIKKDVKGAITEYKAELMLYSDDQSKTTGLPDTLQLAQAYVQPGDTRDLTLACWYYARAWDFAPASYQTRIEQPLEQWYKRYHGALDGLDDLKKQAALTTFPPGGAPTIAKAKTPAEQIHDMLASTADWSTLALADKETVLAIAAKEDADKLWALMQGKETQVPGIVVDATASVIKVAVTKDNQTATPMVADFVVNLKTPLADKDIPKAGFTFGISPEAQLNATYDSYAATAAHDDVEASAQLVLKDGVIVPAEKKKATPPAHKPSAAHHVAAAAH